MAEGSWLSKALNLKTGAFAVSAACHCCAGIAYALADSAAPSDSFIRALFYSFLAVSVGMVLWTHLTTSYAHFIVLSAGRFLLVFLIASQSRFQPGIGACLWCALTLETGLFHPFRRALAIGVAMMFGVVTTLLLFRDPGTAWTERLTVVLLFSAPVAVVLASAMLVTYYRERYVEATDELDRMGQAVEQLTNANTGYQQYAARAGEDSSRNERRRITRELHDILGYSLTNVGMMLQASQHLIPENPAKLGELLETAREQINECYTKSRAYIHRLRDRLESSEQGLQAIAKLTNVFHEATGIEVHVEYGNAEMSYGERVDAVLYRTVQEGMVNAFRHGRASTIDIFFRQHDDTLSLNIFDDGRGSPFVKKGVGLSGMEERVEQLGGKLLARNCLRGFELSLTLPLPGNRQT